ncbi:MAG TPA: DUF4397 domain-containing protein [Acidobacteriaceae bacterium]
MPMANLLSHPAKSLARLAALGLLLATLPGCQNIQTTAGSSASIRFVNASPDKSLPGLDMYQNSIALAYNVGFPYITSPIPLNSGTYTFSADGNGTSQVLISAKQPLAAPHEYTAIIGNIAANLQETVFLDQTTPAPVGDVAIRFIDEATSVGPVDIYLVPSSGKLIATTPVATSVNFGGNTGYINVPTDTYAIAVVPAGAVPLATTQTLYTGAEIAYSGSAVRTYVLVDAAVTTAPAVAVIEGKDYDSPSATN